MKITLTFISPQSEIRIPQSKVSLAQLIRRRDLRGRLVALRASREERAAQLKVVRGLFDAAVRLPDRRLELALGLGQTPRSRPRPSRTRARPPRPAPARSGIRPCCRAPARTSRPRPA